MKKLLAMGLVIALCLGSAFAAIGAETRELLIDIPTEHVQEYMEEYEWDLIPVYVVEGRNKKYGYADKTGKIVVPLEYKMAYPMTEGFGLLQGDGKSSFVDKTGKIVMEFPDAQPFYCGKAIVQGDNGQYGMIDKTGEMVIPAIYSKIPYSYVKIGGTVQMYKVYDERYVEYSELVYVSMADGQEYDHVKDVGGGLFEVWKGQKAGFINEKGEQVVPLIYEVVKYSIMLGNKFIYNEDEELWEVCKREGFRDYKYGMIDKTGKEIIPVQYDFLGRFSDGLVSARKKEGDSEHFSYLDKTGKEVLSIEYNNGYNFSEGLAGVVNIDAHGQGKCGYIDKTGKLVIPRQYYTVDPFCEGLAVVSKLGSDGTLRWGVIDKTGKTVLPLGKYGIASEIYPGGKIEVSSADGKGTGLVDVNNGIKVIVPMKYNRAMPQDDGTILTLHSSGIGNGLYDASGNEVISIPENQEDRYWLSKKGDLFIASKNGSSYSYGLLDNTGKEILPLDNRKIFYDEASGLYQVAPKEGETPYCVDSTGKRTEFLQTLPGGAVLRVVDYDRDWICALVGAPDAEGPVQEPAETGTAYQSTQTVDVNGEKVEFRCYALKDENGNDTNYIKLRDLAFILRAMSDVKFDVAWNAELGAVDIVTGKDYQPNGSELETPFSGDRPYATPEIKTLIDGNEEKFDAFQLQDDAGGGYTYYKLRDLGKALGITVDWTAERGIFIETR